jgi:hypothetical protein
MEHTVPPAEPGKDDDGEGDRRSDTGRAAGGSLAGGDPDDLDVSAVCQKQIDRCVDLLGTDVARD